MEVSGADPEPTLPGGGGGAQVTDDEGFTESRSAERGG